MHRTRLFALTAACAAAVVWANPEAPQSDYSPKLAAASDEASRAIRRFAFDKALQVEVWAAEPMLAHPVAFAFDEKGRCFVAETFRHSHGVTDNRGHMKWLEEDLAARTVAERVAMYRRDAGARFAQTYEKERERVRLLEDTTGAGKADRSTVFCDDFGRAEDGLGAGVLARQGNVYFTCIPDLWLLKDTKGTGRADVKESLSSGYGVHVAFIGHDLHGLRIGPDGRLYFTVGDRGLNVKTREGRTLFYPDTGAVLRCELDGSNLEVVHSGLRNPQELAFDDYGNLFTIDNNSDSGDQARWVYVAEGGDSGWRMGYQYGSAMSNRGPWNAEKLWHLEHAGQPAYILPPLKHYTAGPSGFAHYPGVGLAERYRDHFFICDFRGNSGGSGVRSFAAKPKGASFELVDDHQFLWSVLATDCDFGPDGAFYVSDWIEGWNITGKGRIYKVTDPAALKNPAVAEAKKLLAEGFGARSSAELAGLLGHPHQQVRLEAQFALAAKGKEALEPLTQVAKKGQERLARLHAIWGLGMLGRREEAASQVLLALLPDADEEVRAQAVKSLGDGQKLLKRYAFPDDPPSPGDGIEGEEQAYLCPQDMIAELLLDRSPRVRYLAAQTLGRLPELAPTRFYRRIAPFLLAEANREPYLRHAGVMALVALRSPAHLLQAAKHKAPALRLAAALALRRLGSPDVALLLDDPDLGVAAEAARAVHDADITAALPKLAALITKLDRPEPVLYRVLNAHFRLGKPENAGALAQFAAEPKAPETLRVLAVRMLGDWAKPSRRDFVTGLTQDLGTRPENSAVDVLRPVLSQVFAGPVKVQQEAARVASKLHIQEVGPFLFGIVTDAKHPAGSRADALLALEALKYPRLDDVVSAALGSDEPRLRHAARVVLANTKPDEGLKQLAGVLEKGEVIEQQAAFALLAAMRRSAADELLSEWLDRLLDRRVAPALMLDLLEAAGERVKARRPPAKLKEQLARYESSRPKDDELGRFRETVTGGDAERGRNVFLTHAAASCQRCHKLDGEGGEVGPPLNGIGARVNRDYLLSALVLPNKDIAKGYDSVVITKLDGQSISGVLRAEDAKELTIVTPEGTVMIVPKDDVDERRPARSAMPDDLGGKLTKSEIRDLVEFLASLKQEWKK